MTPATKARLDRLERLFLNLISTINLHTEITMSEFDDLRANIEILKQQGLDAKADADRQAGLVTQGVGLLQALTAKIGELAGQPGGATPAQLAELRDNTAAAVADFNAANTARDTSDAALAGGIGENTPA